MTHEYSEGCWKYRGEPDIVPNPIKLRMKVDKEVTTLRKTVDVCVLKVLPESSKNNFNSTL